MVDPGRILIIDDDRDFAGIYEEMLESQGVEVAIAYTVDEAVRYLESAGARLDVVLLDQKLKGGGGFDTSLDLISSIQVLVPFLKIIVVTGYAAPEAIERAFKLGVYNYLVKNGAFEALLRATVRNAIEVASEHRAASRSREELRSVWDRVRSETDSNRKGKFTSAFHEQRARRQASEVLVIPVDAEALQRWLDANDKLDVLRELHKSATFGTAR